MIDKEDLKAIEEYLIFVITSVVFLIAMTMVLNIDANSKQIINGGINDYDDYSRNEFQLYREIETKRF